MRVHVYLDDDLVNELDALVDERGRSKFIEEAVRQRVDRERRWRLMRSAIGSIADGGHPWDPDPAGFFHRTRSAESAARDARLEQAFRE
jgi:hypothetical protein